ncbi:MAG: PAS domain S-box protein [Flexistipes sinusarabici]|uniref:histidine kinase n=1 Tax=Flexistipes sinusarabici TaxID=2352 RepID=A0A5D0MPX7_FLESI|nr:PAS domain S-box protein [Flexistipes sinusarabici]TYB33631.1 MAG: PAS domain S-box protein [Flexistipes sinusarabici]
MENSTGGDKEKLYNYLKEKINHLLEVLGTKPLNPDELDLKSILSIDPIGIIAESFDQILEHLNETNEELLTAKEEISAIFNSVGVGILVIDKSCRIHSFNYRLCEMLETDEREIYNLDFAEIFPYEVKENYCNDSFHRESFKEFHNMPVKNKYFDLKIVPLQKQQGATNTFIISFNDITDKIHSELMFQQIYDNANDMIIGLDTEGVIKNMNSAARLVLCCSDDELIGKKFNSMLTEDYNSIFPFELREIVSDSCTKNVELKLIDKQGNEIYVDGSFFRGKLNASQTGVLGILRDITDKKTVEKELERERELISVTLRSINDGVITVNEYCQVIMINKTAEEMLALSSSEAEDVVLEKILNFSEVNQLPLCRMGPKKYFTSRDYDSNSRFCLTLRNKKGDDYKVDVFMTPLIDRNSNIIGGVVVLKDITDYLRVQEELLNSSKMESLSIMARGIAHDYNNILTAVMSNVSLAKLKAESESVAKVLKNAENAVVNAKNLTMQLSTFAKEGVLAKEVVSLKDFLKSVCDFTLSGSSCYYNVHCAQNVSYVEVDKSKLSQVINNLLVNAMQAMPGGGKIGIGCKNIDVDEDTTLPLQRGRYVSISVVDEGKGIPESQQNKIFDPFFTTKEDGTGLGLATSYSIIKKHGGHIVVDSTVGEGTAFHIYLPAKKDGTGHKTEKESNHIQKYHKKILIMDDNENVLESTSELLRELGGNVDAVRSGEKAVEKFAEAFRNGEPYDLSILDITMPGGFGGKKVFKEIIKIDPEAKCVISSGFTSDDLIKNYKKYGFYSYLHKPYALRELNRLLMHI